MTERPWAAESVDLFDEGPEQPEFVQRGWPQVIDDPAQVTDGLLGVAAQLGQQPIGLVGGCGQDAAGGVGLQCHRGQDGPEAVVEVAAQPPAFLLARGHQPLS